MLAAFRDLFSGEGFMPHGMCYLWRPDVLALHVVSDGLITLAYFSIPFTLLYFVRKRKDLQFHWVFQCFAVFIVACGTTHLMEIWVIWEPVYWLSGSIKALTAAASVPTAILLVKLIPEALRVPSPAMLQAANAQLEREIAERKRAEQNVLRLNEELEHRVMERTRQLEQANRDLLEEIAERERAEQARAQTHLALQQAYEDLRQTQRTVMQHERLRVLGQMASGIAHDINNAISPITLYTESLLRHEAGLSDAARKQIATIQRAVEEVAGTVARMREFYRPRELQSLQAGLSLNAMVAEVVQLTRARWRDVPQQQGVHIELHTELHPALPNIEGATHEIRDALTNLIFNALDAMPSGGTIMLRTQPATTAVHGLHACIEVHDTGTGMDEETRRRCLEPFFTTKGERGTGLGLAMVYGMVQRHGAELEIDSEVGRGTTVRVLFPASTTAATADARYESTSAPPLRILVIDDDPILLESLQDTLQRDGHDVITAAGGQPGIDAFAAASHAGRPFALVITDFGMPIVDGRKVAIAVRTLSPVTPIVLVTGWGQQLIEDSQTATLFDRILSKPPRLHELRRALAELASTRIDKEAGSTASN